MGAALKCFLCSSEPLRDPVAEGFQMIHAVDPHKGVEADITLCLTCYSVACMGSDQAAVHLWSALQEAQSAGYTDAGFVHQLYKEFRNRGGLAAIGWIRWEREIQGEMNDLEGCFLLGALPNPTMPTLPLIWCRSRLPCFPALLRACEEALPSFEIPQPMNWDQSGRFFIAPIPNPGQPFVAEKNPAVLEAVLLGAREHYGDRDFFTLLANEETGAGFELIRRWML